MRSQQNKMNKECVLFWIRRYESIQEILKLGWYHNILRDEFCLGTYNSREHWCF